MYIYKWKSISLNTSLLVPIFPLLKKRLEVFLCYWSLDLGIHLELVSEQFFLPYSMCHIMVNTYKENYHSDN